jgi:glycosyltransferase involved in cell wall biosynthesis
VISIGAFIPSYGFHQVVAAVESLRQSRPDVELTLLDGGFARDESYRRMLIADRPWITVHEGVAHDQVGAFLANSQVFVRAFAHESYGLSRVEAILSGTPVIATNIGETRGILTYEFGDVYALTDHLRSVLSGACRIDLSHWQQVYRREAEQNLQGYIRLITGDSNA